MAISVLGAEALKAGMNFLGGLFGQHSQQEFNAREAQKNRDFQERMYNQQVQDNINFWKMQADYDTPSAQLARIREAGLNPLLAYEGGVSATMGSAPQAAQAPNGSQAQKSFNNPIDVANLALLEAQIDNIHADSEKKRNESAESRSRNVSIVLQNEITERTKEASIAAAEKNVDKLHHEIEWLATQDFALTNITAASLDNLASVIEYRKKYYQIDEQKMLNEFWYMTESIALGKQHVSNEMKRIAVEWYNAKTQRSLVDGELKKFDAEIQEINARKDLTEQEKSNKILEAYNQVLQNTMMENLGTSDLGSLGGLILLMTGQLSGRTKGVGNY